MKLSRRIRDLVRAGIASPRRYGGWGRGRSPAGVEAQLEQIRKSLARAAVREGQLREELALAEEEGRERDAVRLRRELADLDASIDELQATLDLIQARIEMEGEREVAAEPDQAAQVSTLSEETDASEATVAGDSQDDAELASRKTRLTAPKER